MNTTCVRPNRSERLVAALVLVLVMGLSAPAMSSETIDPTCQDRRYAWSENAGWLNAEPLGDGGPGLAIFDDIVFGWIWSENLGWISASCTNTDSCATVDFGLAIDTGTGDFSGWAWGENIGWISLSCSNTSSCATVDYGVNVDLVTGEISGWAWSENVGWISLSCTNTGSCATVDFGVTTQVPLLIHESLVFADGFECGDTGGWGP